MQSSDNQHGTLWGYFLRYEGWVVLTASIGFAVTVALIAGADNNWDLRNYHYWSVYAWLEGRTFHDIAPAQIQSWFNPAIYVPFYLLAHHGTPLIGTSVIAGLAGINGLMLYLIVTRILPDGYGALRIPFAMLAAICGLTAPMFASQLGSSFADPLGAILILSALLLLISRYRFRHLAAGCLIGAAVGFKLTFAPYALGAALALLVTWRAMGISIVGFTAFAAGGILGALLTGGAWAVFLFAETGNPLFPFYNEIFRSPLYDATNFFDRTFLPDSFLSAVSYPFKWLFWGNSTAELHFRDARFAIIILAFIGILFLPVLLRGRNRGEHIADSHFYFLLVFFAASFVLWLTTWSIQRYVTTLELLSGVMILLAVDRVPVPIRLRLLLFAGIVAFSVYWTVTPSWGRTDLRANHYFVTDPAGTPVIEDGTLFVMVGGGHPIAYAIPDLPKDARFVRLTSNLGPLDPDRQLGEQISEVVREHPGPIRTLSAEALSAGDSKVLARFGLELIAGCRCETLRLRWQELHICDLRRTRHAVDGAARTDTSDARGCTNPQPR